MIEKGTAVGCPFEIVKKACHCEETQRLCNTRKGYAASVRRQSRQRLRSSVGVGESVLQNVSRRANSSRVAASAAGKQARSTAAICSRSSIVAVLMSIDSSSA